MTRLQQALERYKHQTPKVSLYPVERAERFFASEAEQITYTQSRSVDVPEEILRRHRVVTGSSVGRYAESYKRLRTQVLHRLQENHWNVLGVLSPRAHEGKTSIAMNLAIVMAMDTTLTVLLVDADLRGPHLHEVLGISQSPGLSDYLQGSPVLKDCLVHPNLGRLVVLPGGEPVSNSAEWLTSHKMAHVVQEMKNRYAKRVVIFDLPPLLESADSLAFAPSLDAALLVVEEGRTTRSDLEESVHTLKGAVPILGTVFNKAGRQFLSVKTAKQLSSVGKIHDHENVQNASLWKRILKRAD